MIELYLTLFSCCSPDQVIYCCLKWHVTLAYLSVTQLNSPQPDSFEDYLVCAQQFSLGWCWLERLGPSPAEPDFLVPSAYKSAGLHGCPCVTLRIDQYRC